MEYIGDGQVWRYLFGDRLPRWTVIGSVVSLLALASVGFLLGMDVRLYEFWGWLVIVPGTAVIAGILGAGFVPTVGSLWLISLWGYVFPPLVGYLTGEWMGAGRYTTPRMLGFAYGSARAELLGGLETSVNFGLALAVIVGTTGYVAGSVIRWMAARIRSA
ncbi:hypothetical protein [Halorubrum ezzemoulense]|uniref:Uncharacterized protein n=1 Tax=Halorubrum ezzemoulense TaxID=337243 RepID=A0A256JX81_HALEZ|nr:hypothetical protein [Halorubrum ezzemoulense]OYR73401.1 hypothetical protein DJ76_10060 [Halorubrum ezzemoulense]